jgi:predicted nucleotidyltransferase
MIPGSQKEWNMVNRNKMISPKYWSEELKKNAMEQIKRKLSPYSEISKIVIFGSFATSSIPNDIDIAIFQHSDDNYLTLSLKYRKALRELSSQIPLDVIPVKIGGKGIFLEEIEKGRVIYEKGN